MKKKAAKSKLPAPHSKPKRPTDVNEIAHLLVEQSTTEADAPTRRLMRRRSSGLRDMTDEYVFGPQVQRVMQGEGISPDELMEMLRKSAITSLRGFNRRYYDWLFKIQGRSVEPALGAGYRLAKGVNHLTGVTAINWGRDKSISSQDRLLRQQTLMRDVLTKIAADHLLTNPITMVHVLDSINSSLRSEEHTS